MSQFSLRGPRNKQSLTDVVKPSPICSSCRNDCCQTRPGIVGLLEMAACANLIRVTVELNPDLFMNVFWIVDATTVS